MRIGIDVGGTKILAGVLHDDGTVVERRKIPTEAQRGYAGVRDDIINLIRELNSKYADISHIGIASAGQIDRKSKRILFSPNLSWHDVPLREDVEETFGIITNIENDANAAVYGEWKCSLRSGPETVLGIFIGTGVGGGLILGRRLFRGFSWVGAELGHVIVHPYGYRCNCGNRGCLEAYCGGAYLTERVRAYLRKGYRGKIWDLVSGDLDNVHPGHIEEAASMGDGICLDLWQEAIEYLGCGLAGLVNIINPEVIIFGGGVVFGTKTLVSEAVKVMERRAMGASLTGLRIERAQLGEDAQIVGAALLDTV